MTQAAAVSNTGLGFGSFSYRTYVLATLTVVYTFNFIDRVLISVIGREIISEFELNNFQYGLLSGIGFAFFYTFLGIPIASLSERYNRVRIIGACVILWSLATALCGWAWGFWSLLAFRLLVGVGEAGCTPPANSLISDYYPPKARATALGIYAMGVTLGGVLAQLGGGWMISNLTWREAFIYVGLPGVLVGALVLTTVREAPRGYSDPPDAPKLTKAGIGETLQLLKTKPTFWIMAAGATIAAFAGYSLVSFQPLFVQYKHGLSPGVTAIYYMAPIGVAGAAGSFLGGWLTEQASKRSPTAPGWVSGAGGLLCVPFYVAGVLAGDLTLMLAFFMIAGLFHYFYLGAQYNIGQAVAPSNMRATTIAILLFVVNMVGYGAGPPIMGLVADTLINEQLASLGFSETLNSALCANRAQFATLAPDAQSACKTALSNGMSTTTAVTASLYALSGVFFIWAGYTLLRDRYGADPATA